MKKVLSVLLALVCVFSFATMAFAGVDQNEKTHNYCPYCNKAFEIGKEDAAFKDHISTPGVCNVKYRSCRFGCGSAFADEKALGEHEYICEKCNATCDYCGAEGVTLKHIDECKAKYHNIPVAKILATLKSVAAKVIDAVKKIDFSAVAGKIKPAIDKVVDLVKGAGK